ncbi:MAG: DUF177 domain-containing protein [Chlorobi bacterium]|nr:DUF177 domain-containing protein [Chlorobiota bacterium]
MKRKDKILVLRIAGLSDGVHEYTVTVAPKAIGLSESFRQPFDVNIVLEKTRRQFVLHVTSLASGWFPCDRCLDETEVRVEVDFWLVFMTTGDQHAISSDDEDNKEVVLLPPNTHEIDIAEDVRQFIELAVPLRKICGEDNEGHPLCKSKVWEKWVGEPETADTRWDALKKLKL